MKRSISILLIALCIFTVSCSPEDLGVATREPATESIGTYAGEENTEYTEDGGESDVAPSESTPDSDTLPTDESTSADGTSVPADGTDVGVTSTGSSSATTGKPAVTTSKPANKPTETTSKAEVTTAKEEEPIVYGPSVFDLTSDAYSELLSGDEIIKIEITMTAANLTVMRRDAAIDESYYKANVNVDGVACNTAGIRVRGNTTYVTTSGSNRYSYRLKFNKYGSGTVNGLDELCLNNMAYDPSFLREYLTYKAFACLDADAPLVSLATVSINGETPALYLAVEAVDNSFLDRCFGGHGGNLYKAGRDSTLLSGATGFELKSGSDTALSKLTALSRALSSGQNIESVLDVSSVLKYAAVNAVITNEDSYMGEKAQNYFLYENGGKISILPWDYNLAFGTDTSARKDNYTVKTSLITASVDSPYFGVSADQRPLVSKLLANSKYKNEYLTYVKKLTQFLDTVQRDLPQLKTMIKNTVNADSTKFYSDDLFEKEFANSNTALCGFIKARCAAVKSQIK